MSEQYPFQTHPMSMSTHSPVANFLVSLGSWCWSAALGPKQTIVSKLTPLAPSFKYSESIKLATSFSVMPSLIKSATRSITLSLIIEASFMI